MIQITGTIGKSDIFTAGRYNAACSLINLNKYDVWEAKADQFLKRAHLLVP